MAALKVRVSSTNSHGDRKPGGEWDGKWWGGVYGWNFRPLTPDGAENPGNNCVMRGARIGFETA